ncbi:heterokaryon incompatibility protein-domain-containing protein [Paraphoma chrysanthemicola]|uniref:Heterokaryon incompatibility protein-domain-containing protein n=1 Tax=Paraphoma chrysanthemicola TaxID=798071 RepID=A0A8K0RD48_9PLEO|nr:heterokaryon incompatibility protein-domain-containing protein [Paraphoma chrysanthemicola]
MTSTTRRRQPRRKAKQHLSRSSIYHRTVQGATASSSLDHQTITSRTGPRLCARCQHIDFRAIFTTQKGLVPPDDGRFIMYLDQSLHDPSCRACNLFEKVACSERLGIDASLYHLRVFSVESLFEVKQATTQMPHAVALAVLPGKEGRKHDNWRRYYLEGGLVLANSLAPSAYPAKENGRILEVAALKISEVNYGCCKAWIEDCINLHGRLCTATKEPRRFSIPLTCIDCNTNEIKHISNNDRYAALSYVWGATTGNISKQDYGHVLVHASQTIQDAMQVVRRLGIRYLWVDQYCVDQQNHDIKNIQIAEMDRVYAGAHVTIVAAAGSNAEYGLPGVSRVRSYAQPTLAVDDLELGSSLPFLARVMKNTTWSTRAWTYQEAVLSRRCLFFTEYQVYYTCHQMTRCEAVRINEPMSPDEDTTEPTLSTMNAIMFRESQWDHDGSLHNFTRHVAEYTKRSLKYSSDILNAFRGLLSRSSVYNFCGIPIESDPNSANFGVAFAIGLD